MDTRAFDAGVVLSALPQMLEFLDITLLVGISSIVLGSLLGGALAWAKLSQHKILNYLAQLYIYIMRCTPSIVMLFIVFYGLPALVKAVFEENIHDMDRAVFAIIAFTLLFSAYVSEIFRAGIQSIDKGQMEAGRSLGLTWVQTMRYIIMPQAFKAIIPPLGNEFIAMMKDTSLVSVIGFEELTRRGQLIIARTYGSFEIWSAVAVIYLVMTLSISRLVAYLERRYKI